MRFHTIDLVSKWGFQDGDQLDDLCFDLEDDGIKVSSHALLEAVIRRHIVPALDQSVELQRIQTIHNPVRAFTVDGVDVTDLHYEPFADNPITPEVVEVPNETLVALAKELAVAVPEDE